MKVSSDLFKVMRSGKKLLKDSDPNGCGCMSHEIQKIEQAERGFYYSAFILGICLILAMIMLIFAGSKSAHAETINYAPQLLANAIYKAENSKTHPYGIKSELCLTEASCRKICLNSIHNARKRWIAAGSKGDFIAFMGQRYSPPSINPNWVRLVKYFLAKEVRNG